VDLLPEPGDARSRRPLVFAAAALAVALLLWASLATLLGALV
jgi:hypothetical protein